VPNVTSPSALPFGLATAFFLHPDGPVFFSVASEHVPNPLELIFAPAGRKKLTAASGGLPPAGFC